MARVSGGDLTTRCRNNSSGGVKEDKRKKRGECGAMLQIVGQAVPADFLVDIRSDAAWQAKPASIPPSSLCPGYPRRAGAPSLTLRLLEPKHAFDRLAEDFRDSQGQGQRGWSAPLDGDDRLTRDADAIGQILLRHAEFGRHAGREGSCS